ncbi:hypothetical protein CORMATOL_00658 [Corynebacterium matruchotii ATCC 33806]|uniref:Uncharacterized protein n=1 Tax=Corynebacterium matruchotii ATCC 33806 TaxID=566549 RepID=C0E108_9CORY|nr:hypothetical protein CORMATOL_00658 [Corynebacterium matruchotii ATCC 33806]
MVYLVWAFPTWWVFLFRGESPTPPAENEGKHYLVISPSTVRYQNDRHV